jgi:hypothetical protein
VPGELIELEEGEGASPAAGNPGPTGGPLNRYLTDAEILGCCHELLVRSGANATVRELQEILRARFGMAGKTSRINRLWREVAVSSVEVPRESDVILRAREQVETAERVARNALNAAEAAEARAILSEERERSHQIRWAGQIDELRQRLASYQKDADRVAELEARNLNLHRQLAVARQQLLERDALPPPGSPADTNSD